MTFGNFVAQIRSRRAAFFRVNCIQNFREHVARFTRRQIRGRGFDCHRAPRKPHQFKPVGFKFRFDHVERRSLSGRKIECFGDEHRL